MNDKETVISAFITNLGKYNEGELLGKWHDFPTTNEEIQKTFNEIGIDGINYEEFFITDYNTDIKGICDYLSEYESIDELNYFATRLEDMDDNELEIFESAISLNYCCDNLKNLINLTENLDCYDYFVGVNDEYDLGYYWINDSGCYDIKSMGLLHNYFDYESFGRDIGLEESGAFTDTGYICNRESIDEVYDGVTIPDEYKVFSSPNKIKQKVIN
jgi:antirestriction protein